MTPHFIFNRREFRGEEFTDGVGAARIVRYLRYGWKKENQIYVKAGDISETTLGFGFIMYNYSNQGSFEKRTLGTEFDLHYQRKLGIEGIYSDFSKGIRGGVWGIRPYLRPLSAVDLGPVWLRSLQVGVTYVTDQSDEALPVAVSDNEPFSIWGLDGGFLIPFSRENYIVPYFAYAKNPEINSELTGGSGWAIGINGIFNSEEERVSVAAKFEKRFYQGQFVGSYFDAIYKANKFGFFESSDSPSLQHPIDKLRSRVFDGGIFASLYLQFIKKIGIGGSVQIQNGSDVLPVGQQDLGGTTLHLEVNSIDLIPRTFIKTDYARNFITDFGDAFKLDENSVINTRLALNLFWKLWVGLDYKWTFAKAEEQLTPKATSYYFPFVALETKLRSSQRRYTLK